MSYLVDALKKAERERHENQRADLRSLAGGEPTTSSTGRMLRWLIGILVGCNAALLVYLFMPAVGSAEMGAIVPEKSSAPAAAVVADTKTAGTATAGPAENPPPATAPESESVLAEQRPAETLPPGDDAMDRMSAAARLSDSAPRSATQDTSSSMTLPPSRPAEQRQAAGAALDIARDDRRQQRGRVTYSATPLGDDSPYRVDESRTAAVSEGAPAGAPDIEINGHLYSSVPGRSFILVRGRRYHEGERLAAGPAVESIDAAGATLNYRGERYHVRGPG